MKKLTSTTVALTAFLLTQSALAAPNQSAFPLHSNSAFTSSYQPFTSKGGINASIPVIGATGALTPPTLGDIFYYANNSIQQQMINAANGVAGLNSNGILNSTLQSSSVYSGPTINNQFVPIISLYTPNQSAISGGYETVHIGGSPLALTHSPYGIYAAQGGNLTISSGLNGPYNAGCGLCLFNDPQTGKLGAISGEDYRTGFVATHDGVMLEEGITNAQARLVLPVSGYTSTSVQLSTPLTANEMSQIQPGMYIVTNSVPSGANQVPIGDSSLNGLLPPFQNYSGIVKDVTPDGKTIDVYSWGQELTTGTATPSTSSIDTVWDPQTTGPVVYVGAANKEFAENDFSSYNGNVAGGSGGATSLVHQMEHIEIDQNVSNENRKYAVQYHGLTIISNASRPDVLTKDSYQISLNGGQSQFITMSPQWWTIPINSDPLYVGALQGPALQTGAQAVLASFGQSTNTGNASFQSFHYIRPTIYNTRTASDGSGTDYQNIETDIGVGIDGNRGTVNAIQEHIALNPANYHNGISLCGYATCGLSIDGNGVGWQPYDFHITAGNALWLESSAGDKSYFYSQTNPNGGYPTTHVVVPANSSGAGVFYVDGAFGTGGLSTLASLNVKNSALFQNGIIVPTGKSVQFSYNSINSYLTLDSAGNMNIVQGASAVGGGFADAGYPLSSLPTTEPTDGTHVWCYDCSVNSIKGVEAYWHSSAAKWTDSQNNNLHN